MLLRLQGLVVYVTFCRRRESSSSGGTRSSHPLSLLPRQLPMICQLISRSTYTAAFGMHVDEMRLPIWLAATRTTSRFITEKLPICSQSHSDNGQREVKNDKLTKSVAVWQNKNSTAPRQTFDGPRTVHNNFTLVRIYYENAIGSL